MNDTYKVWKKQTTLIAIQLNPCIDIESIEEKRMRRQNFCWQSKAQEKIKKKSIHRHSFISKLKAFVFRMQPLLGIIVDEDESDNWKRTNPVDVITLVCNSNEFRKGPDWMDSVTSPTCNAMRHNEQIAFRFERKHNETQFYKSGWFKRLILISRESFTRTRSPNSTALCRAVSCRVCVVAFLKNSKWGKNTVAIILLCPHVISYWMRNDFVHGYFSLSRWWIFFSLLSPIVE